MFMRANRSKSGTEQPEVGASRDASAQRSNQKLAPNETLPANPEDYRFTPSMSTSAQINDQHYQGGISGDGPYGTTYETHIPSVGQIVVHTEGDRKLKG